MMGSVYCNNFSEGNNTFDGCLYLLQVALAIAKGTTILDWCESNLNFLLNSVGASS